MKNIDVTPLKELLEYIDPQDLGEIIDDVLFDYAYCKVEKCEDGSQNITCRNMYYLRFIRDTLLKIRPAPEG